MGGFMLLKKRHKRLMGRGQYSGYPDTSQSRDLKQDDDDNNESKRQGGSGFRGLVTSVLSKAQSLASPKGSNNSNNKSSATIVAAPATTPAVAMQQQQAQHVRAASPTPVPAANWGTASSPPPTLMGNVVPPSTLVVGPNYGADNGISSNYPGSGNNNHALISQPLYLPPTPQDQQPLNWQQQQVLQQQQLQQQQQQQQQQFQQQQLQQQYQQQLQQQQQHQIQHMPIQGYATLPPIQAAAMTPQHQLQHQSYQQQQQQQPVQMQQVQRSMVSPTNITTPMSQPYYYQPGTGLVSVPLSLSPAEPYTPQPFQPHPVQVVQAITAAPPMSYGLNNAHYPVPPVSVASVSHVPPPPSHQHIQQQPVAYLPPPPATQATIPTTVAAVPTSAAPRSPTPESGSIFLPGDSSRLLLSQGLFKIVPDAEDEEEAKRAAEAAVAASSSQIGPNPALSMDLNLGGDFLSSVLNHSNHNGPSNTNTFSSIPQGPSAAAAPAANGGAGSGAQGQPVRQQPGYHDRQAGQKDRPKNQPRYLIDKEEYVGEQQQQQQHVQNESSSNRQQNNSEPVIVGSDIVFEPLPSVKAARERSNLNGGSDSTSTSSSSLLNNNKNSSNNQAVTKESSQTRPTRNLSRAPTLGEVLPTMGTEEYLERTDDKEEYSARLHGARESSTVASPTPTKNVIHPTRVGELSKEAEGGIVDIGTPITPNAILPTTTAAEGAATGVIPPRSSTAATPPPPLRLSTKPKFK
ncbi:hypothetical protein BG015_006805 [Linnemannia schmuckeri]|uniref:Uncharacterized protein n=1 Tax=Linnemannia schmuckeri TaxID=64567 RepID=A0A9P5VBV9_9FUNG|nr:hypothetical protein BG015_006805 [Linnemannia schmuckeri]